VASGPLQVVPARAQMGSSLGFHIILACLGIAFPAIVMTAHYRGLRHRDHAALLLARRWSKVMAVLVAVGAVSGTVLSFDMGLLWPGLMGRYGSVIGIPFSFEGIFFLLEAVFTAIYLYGWDRLRPWAHFWSLSPVVITGIGGAVSVVAANAWMNDPAGFTTAGGRITSVDPVAVFFNGASWYETPHMVLAAYMVAGGLAATPYAVGLLRGRRDRYHRLGFLIPFSVAAIATPFQIAVGDTAARAIARQQPVKFASMEYVPVTARGVPEWIGGIWYHGHVVPGTGLALPDVDSLLVGFSPHTEVTGWDTVPAALRPPLPTLIHLSFDVMVGIGTLMLLWGLWLALWWWRRRDLPAGRLGTVFLAGGALSGVAAVVAMEAGWVVTEVGRQPWTVYGVLLTNQAATRASGVVGTLVITLVIYGVLTVATFGILFLMQRRWQAER
jgi:cytochrome bd ubiquinol oxidase subunit I